MREIVPKIPQGTIRAIPAKAHAHRALVAAAMGDAPSTLNLTWFSKDIQATIDSLRALGATIDKTPTGVTILPVPHTHEVGAIVPHESGTTLRLLLPVAMTLCHTVDVDAKGRLPERPLEPLLSQMKAHGVRFSQDKPPFTMTGRLQSGMYEMVGNVSSQFFSGLLMAAPRVGGATIVSTTPLQSRDYVRLTKRVLADFGVPVTEEGDTFTIPETAQYGHVMNYAIEGDWSNAAIWLVASAMTGQSMTVTHLQDDSVQADKRILTVLTEAGCTLTWKGDAVTCTGKASRPLHVDLTQMPDLLPVLAALACSIEGTSSFVNGARLRLKESDRLEAVAALVRDLGGVARVTGDDIHIEGTGRLAGGTADCVNDHRLVMAGTLAALISEKPVRLIDDAAIHKSYPDFFADWEQLGGQTHEL